MTGCAAPWRRFVADMPDHVPTREKLTGHFWQGRFCAVAMDEEPLAAAIRYVAQSGSRAARRRSAGMALVERPCPFDRYR
jgi:hypothetical protein